MNKVQPHSIEAEKSLLGAILFNPESLNEIVEILPSENCFYDLKHRKIFTGVLELYRNEIPIDAVTLGESLTKNQTLESIGGLAYIAELLEKVSSYSNAKYYADIIKEKYILRNLIKKTQDILEDCYDDSKKVDVLVHDAEKSIYEISEETISEGFIKVGEILNSVLKEIEFRSKNKSEVPGVKTCFKTLDKITSGLQKSDLIILAARPSMGKTSFAMNIAFNAAMENKVPTAIFSLEMSSEQIVSRLVSLAAKVPQSNLRTGILSEDEWLRIVNVSEALSEAPIFIDNTYGIDPLTMMSKLRRLKKEANLGLVVIDYLQMMKFKSAKAESRQQEVSEISRALKGIARELNIPVLVLSQLSRQLENRPDKRPQLSDLRESGAIEQDADLCIFLYRDEKYHEDSPYKGMAEIIISKHRNGPLGKFYLTFLDKYMSFENYEDDDSFDDL